MMKTVLTATAEAVTSARASALQSLATDYAALYSAGGTDRAAATGTM